MASYTAITQYKRKIRHKNMGRARKTRLESHGTTPAFDVRDASAVANAPVEQLTPAERAAREN